MKDKKYNYLLTINELDSNKKMRVWYTQKGAELWDWLARRGFVALVPYAGFGYYYRLKNLAIGLKTAWDEGLTKPNGIFYEKSYY